MSNAAIFCTVFDKNYLYQGLAMYRSLERTQGNFRLYALAMDDIAVETLKKLQLQSMTIVSLQELDQKQLSELRPLVSYGQFCWSMQPLLCRYVLDQGESHVTYVEADALFFSDARVAFEEMADHSISLAPHWYSSAFQATAKDSGLYCTHFNFFRKNEVSYACIEYWSEQCFRYRADRPAFVPGQLCLDHWEKKFGDVVVLKNRGLGVAPWNVQQYQLGQTAGIPTVDNNRTIFYHYHQVGQYPDGSYELGDYPLSAEAIRLFYLPYIQAVEASKKEVAGVAPEFNFQKRVQSPPSVVSGLFSFRISELKKALKPYKRKVKGTFNILDLSELKR